MSSEFENQVNEKVFEDNIKKFFFKYKFYIIFFFIIIILVPLIYQSNVYIIKKNNENFMNDYIFALENLQKNDLKKSSKIFEELTISGNDTIVLLSLGQLYKIKQSLQKENELVPILNNILANNKLQKHNLDLVKLQKALLIFDTALESDMLNLLDIRQKKNIFYRLNLEILYDFYLSKNEKIKATNIKSLINEK